MGTHSDGTEYFDLQGRPHNKPDHMSAVPRVSTYGVAFIDSSLLLVQPAWHDFFELPGGKVEADEDLGRSLQREFLVSNSLLKHHFLGLLLK